MSGCSSRMICYRAHRNVCNGLTGMSGCSSSIGLTGMSGCSSRMVCYRAHRNVCNGLTGMSGCSSSIIIVRVLLRAAIISNSDIAPDTSIISVRP